MNRSRTRQLMAGVAAIAVLGAACGSSDDTAGTTGTDSTSSATAQTSGEQAEVRIKDFVYLPEDLTVKVGTTVSWTNEDFFGHTVTSGEPGAQTDTFDGVLGEVAQAEGMDFTFTFNEPGTYDYYCRYHPRMIASVTVTS